MSRSRSLSAIHTLMIGIILCSVVIRLIFMRSANLLVEEAYYWNYAQHLDFGYLDHPPMVAVLIKLSTWLFGDNAFGVRFPSLLCWCVTVGFSVQLTRRCCCGAELYVWFLLAVLPFFFLQSAVMTPDQPLIACWAAALYYLYGALIDEKAQAWFGAGVWIGLGMLSKYTMVLLGPATLVYLWVVPSARGWFSRPEPYACALMALVLFTPVIYWNATHDWASFAFQSTRRLHAEVSFTLHEVLGLMVLFLMPPGVWGLWTLCRSKSSTSLNISPVERRFFQVYTLMPLAWFACFSLIHAIRFNWIGPLVIAMIPWLALNLKQALLVHRHPLLRAWLLTAVVLLVTYASMVSGLLWGTPELLNRTVLKKFIDWENLTQQFDAVAAQVQQQFNTTPVFAVLDMYNLSSELSFYQANLHAQGKLSRVYPIVERHVFGGDSLMYRYWTPGDDLLGKTLILISMDLNDFDNPVLKQRTQDETPLLKLWTQSQGRGLPMKPYYYKVATIRP